LIADEKERSQLPFDLSQMRIVFFDHTDLASAAEAKNEIVVQLRRALDGAVDSPITTALNVAALEGGTRVEQTLAELVSRVDRLATSMDVIRNAFVPITPSGGGGTSNIYTSLYPLRGAPAGNYFLDPSAGGQGITIFQPTFTHEDPSEESPEDESAERARAEEQAEEEEAEEEEQELRNEWDDDDDEEA
jgi:hypothetical protein